VAARGLPELAQYFGESLTQQPRACPMTPFLLEAPGEGQWLTEVIPTAWVGRYLPDIAVDGTILKVGCGPTHLLEQRPGPVTKPTRHPPMVPNPEVVARRHLPPARRRCRRRRRPIEGPPPGPLTALSSCDSSIFSDNHCAQEVTRRTVHQHRPRQTHRPRPCGGSAAPLSQSASTGPHMRAFDKVYEWSLSRHCSEPKCRLPQI
jgi:hypothetical protein